jgi:hypothetical protein
LWLFSNISNFCCHCCSALVISDFIWSVKNCFVLSSWVSISLIRLLYSTILLQMLKFVTLIPNLFQFLIELIFQLFLCDHNKMPNVMHFVPIDLFD